MRAVSHLKVCRWATCQSLRHQEHICLVRTTALMRCPRRAQIRHLVGPMRKLADQCGVPAQNLVWAPMHWSDLSKIQKVWQLNQTTADILHYNAATGAAARAANLTVFETYNDTVGASTIDGLHMTSPVTLRKIHKLLSLLHARQAGAS